MAAGAPPRTRRRDLERHLYGPAGAPPAPDTDDFELPPGWKSRHDEDREAHEAQRARTKASEDSAKAEYSDEQRARRPSSRPAGGRRPGTPPGRRRPRRGRPTFTNPTGGRLPIDFGGQGLGGIFLGAVVYALVLSVVDYGTAGPGLWFKAKFLNEAAGSPASSSPPAPARPASSSSSGSAVLL